MGGNFPLPNEGMSARMQILERAFQGDDVARLRSVNFLDQCSKSGRLAAAGRPGNDDKSGTRLSQSAQVRVQIAGAEILDRARQQANRKGSAADGSEHVDAAARAGHLQGNVRRTALLQGGPARGSEQLARRAIQSCRAARLAQGLKLASYPYDQGAIRLGVQVARAEVAGVAYPVLEGHSLLTDSVRWR